MLLVVLLIVAGLFVLLFGLRMGGAQRHALMARWPAALLALAAIFALSRGAIWPATALGALAALTWILWPGFNKRLQSYDRAAKASAEDPADAQARAILGLGPNPSAADVRQAYRAKMTKAHPDRGGTNAEAARLTAARDRLLKKR